MARQERYDAMVVGSGISGGNIAVHTGFGSSSSSGDFFIRTLNAGNNGVSGAARRVRRRARHDGYAATRGGVAGAHGDAHGPALPVGRVALSLIHI